MAVSMKRPLIGIVGVGMVGGPFARYFEKYKGYVRGTNLFLYDTDPKKKFHDDVNRADVVFISVPTPRNPDGSADMSRIRDAISRFADGKTIVLKSTVPPGTTEAFAGEYPEHQFLFNPEFLTEKNAWQDMLHPDRQIVGFTKKNVQAAELVLSLLPKAKFSAPTKDQKITATEAEYIKYAGNIYLARKVNWANALAKATEKLGANYEHVRAGLAADVRIGKSHLDVNHHGYRGFGGYCFPKDTAAFMAFAKTNGLDDVHALLEADWKFNEQLLAEQGFTIDEVSVHDEALLKKLQTKKKKRL